MMVRSAAPLKPSVGRLLARLILISFYVSTGISKQQHGSCHHCRSIPDGNLAAHELLKCYNLKFSNKASSFDDFLLGRSSRSIRINHVWWSSRNTSFPVTVFTIADLSRLQALAAQCRSYPGGPLVAVVYVPLPSTPQPQAPTQGSSAAPVSNASSLTITTSDDPPPASPPLSAAAEELLRNATQRLEELFRSLEGSSAPPGADSTRHQPETVNRAADGASSDDMDGETAAADLGRAPTAKAAAEGLRKRENQQRQRVRRRAAQEASSSGPIASQQACSLRLLLLTELVGDDVMGSVMPINALRNAAMLATDTPLVTMVDVDLSASWSFAGQLLANASRVKDMVATAARERVVWVMPAWDVHHRLNFSERGHMADRVAAMLPSNKAALIRLWRPHNLIHPFAADIYPAGHFATDYKQWAQAENEYSISYKRGYEPWFIGPRKMLPAYDARFRGYAYNKMVHLLTVAAANFTFRVLPDVWLVHRPHEPTASCHVYTHTPQAPERPAPLDAHITIDGKSQTVREALVAHNKLFYGNAMQLIHQGLYELPLDAAAEHCFTTLSWWRDGSQG